MIQGVGLQMPKLGWSPDEDAGGMPRPEEPIARGPGRLLRGLGWSVLALGAAVAGLLGAGFLWFVWRVPADEVALNRNADGIVALTGGASRVADAMELMAAGRGKRLLISGAYRTTNLGEISRINPVYARMVSCCVDFDNSLNTLGNAIEIKRWAERQGFRSLIVVTSNYHMPRALAEIAHQLPGVALVPFPVVTDRQRAEPWWTNGTVAKLMLSEYVKYVFARLRMGVTSADGVDDARQARAPS
jgi:uncharacterized SAM-binding protein YcdF (DUF218 family)